MPTCCRAQAPVSGKSEKMMALIGLFRLRPAFPDFLPPFSSVLLKYPPTCNASCALARRGQPLGVFKSPLGDGVGVSSLPPRLLILIRKVQASVPVLRGVQ